MDLIERYLALDARCVAHRRPEGAAGDLGLDLRRLLLARIEARETALRRPLRTDEATTELLDFARRLFAESRAVMRRLDRARPGARVTATPWKEAHDGPR